MKKTMRVTLTKPASKMKSTLALSDHIEQSLPVTRLPQCQKAVARIPNLQLMS
jgi:hypothetical protein